MRKFLVVFFILLFSCGVCFAAGDSSGITRNVETVQNDIWNDAQNSIRVGIVSDDAARGRSIQSCISVDEIAAGRCQLSDDSIGTIRVTVAALAGNTRRVWVGDSSVTTDVGYCLTTSMDAASFITLEVDNVQDIYFAAEEPGEGVSWVAIKP